MSEVSMRIVVLICLAAYRAVPVRSEAAISADNSRYVIWQGRVLRGAEAQTPGGVTFSWQGVQATLKVFGATRLTMSLMSTFPGSSPVFHVYVSGKLLNQFYVSGNSLRIYTVVSGLSPNNWHEIVLWYVSDPIDNTWPHVTADAITIKSFSLDDGKFGHAPHPLRHKFLVIGDAVAAGNQISTRTGCKSDQSNTCYAKLCQHFNANCTVVALSGRGLYRNCCDNDATIDIYMHRWIAGNRSTDFGDNGFDPDVVFLNLGASDYISYRKATDKLQFGKDFTTKYVDLLLNLTVRNGKPALPIFCAVGPVHVGYAAWVAMAMIKALKHGAKSLFFLNFTTAAANDGCYGNPGFKAHEQMYQIAKPIVERALSGKAAPPVPTPLTTSRPSRTIATTTAPASFAAKVSVSADSNHVSWQGRVLRSPNGTVMFSWEGVQATLRVTGVTHVFMAAMDTFRNPEMTFHVFVDGRMTKSFSVSTLTHEYKNYTLASSLSADTWHQITLYYITDPMKRCYPNMSVPYHLEIIAFYADAGMFGTAPPERDRRFMIIGDSIAAGDEMSNETFCKTDQSKTCYAKLCQYFEANCTTTAIGGKGLYRNCCDTEDTMEVFTKRWLPGDSSTSFGNRDFVPDAVFLNLGTNDYVYLLDYKMGINGSGKEKFAEGFIKKYVELIINYTVEAGRPDLPVFCAAGPIHTHGFVHWVREAMSRAEKQGARSLHFLNFTSVSQDGCGSHPGVLGNEQMFEIAKPIVEKALLRKAAITTPVASQEKTTRTTSTTTTVSTTTTTTATTTTTETTSTTTTTATTTTTETTSTTTTTATTVTSRIVPYFRQSPPVATSLPATSTVSVPMATTAAATTNTTSTTEAASSSARTMLVGQAAVVVGVIVCALCCCFAAVLTGVQRMKIRTRAFATAEYSDSEEETVEDDDDDDGEELLSRNSTDVSI